MNEQIPNQEPLFSAPPSGPPVPSAPPVSPAPPPPKPRRPLLILALPLLACLACSALAVYALAPLSGKLIDPFNRGLIPVTGNDSPALVPTETPEVSGSDPLPQQRTPVPNGAAYRTELDRRLADCTNSFHDFLVLEQVGFGQLELLKNNLWRGQAKDAAAAFHNDCQSIGSMRDVPPAYARVDELLKKAAAEVQPATDDFAAVLDSSDQGLPDPGLVQSAMRHMLKFIEYTSEAEDILSGLDDLRQI